MLDKREKAAATRNALKARKEKERQDAFEKQCRENEAKGLTWAGYTKTFEGQSITFYMNNVEIACKVDYEMSCPHLEFRGETSVLTETGYRSHFTQVELGQYPMMKEMVKAAVGAIMSEERKRKTEYTLSWEPSLEYLRHHPVQLSLFDGKPLDNSDSSVYNEYREAAVKC